MRLLPCLVLLPYLIVTSRAPKQTQPLSAVLQTRASRLEAGAAGTGCGGHMADYMKQYPSSRTSIFAYVNIDSPDCQALFGNLSAQAAMQERVNRAFWPQICLEARTFGLAQFAREVSTPGSRTYENVHAMARRLAAYQQKGKWFFLRPFCEMNDATQVSPWEFGHHVYRNTPADFALAWTRLRGAFDAEGATNALFVFSPLAAYGVRHEAETLAALNLIPAGGIDVFGLNVYSRPLTAYGGTSSAPIAFEDLVQPWIRLVERSKHKGIPLAVSEMGVSSQASDSHRADWIHRAFRFAHVHKFVLVTYFNYEHPYWQINADTLAGEALKEEIARY